MQLVEEMINAFVKNGAVRIVDPLGRSRDVKNGAGGIGLGTRRRGLDGGSRTNDRVVRDLSTRAEWPENQGEQGQMAESKHKVIVSEYAPGFKTHSVTATPTELLYFVRGTGRCAANARKSQHPPEE
jgi:hypothetical protein